MQTDPLDDELIEDEAESDKPFRPKTIEDLQNMTVWQHLEFWWEVISGFYINFTGSSIGKVSPNLDLCYGNATVLYDDGFGVYEQYVSL